MMSISHLKGASKKKTSDEEFERIREKAFEEIDKKLSQKTILEIKEARERIKKGEFYTEEEAKKILDL
mgnify:CR=1 FL=1